MDGATVYQAIRDFGFPVVSCCALAWYVNKREREARDERAEWRVSLDSFAKAVAELTTAIRAVVHTGPAA